MKSALLEDKTAVVVGVGPGLGREVSAALLDAGARVVIADHSAGRLAASAQALDATGTRVLAMPADIADDESCQALVGAALDHFGSIDAVVIVGAYQEAFGGLFDSELSMWHKSFDTNVVGALRLLRAAVPAMKTAGGGSVVLIGAQAASNPLCPKPATPRARGVIDHDVLPR